MSEPQDSQPQRKKEDKELQKRTSAMVRRVGYVFFFGAALYVFIPMIIGAAVGIHRDRIWDPYTGHKLAPTQRKIDCPEVAREMLVKAGTLTKDSSTWEESYRMWLSRCKSPQFSAIHDMLRKTRRDLQKKGLEHDE